MMPNSKRTVEDDARARAEHTFSDGKPIMDKALLLCCADEIDRLKAALADIADNGQGRGGIWARNRAEEALDHRN